MALIKVAARNWKVEIEGATADTYVQVKGLTEIGFGSDKNDRETTDFDSEGWEEHLVASRNKELELTGYYLEDPDTGDRDEGQELVDDLGDAIGEDSLGKFKLTSPGGVVREFLASANPAEVGGGNDDTTSWGAELTVSGKVTKA